MDKILIVSSNDKITAAITRLLKDTFPQCTISAASNSNAGKKAVVEKNFDAVLINCPLSDEYGFDLAELTTRDTMASCIMIVKSDNAEDVIEQVEDYGIMVIPKPISKSTFYHNLKFVSASRKQLLGLQTENIKLHKKLEEIRIINRAKFALMQYLNFTEEQAHKYLEKQAMDTRVPKIEVAMKIIKMYDY
ncbi:MAG: ANTAR domain-containing response regulator [Oscillospiraceae bacterium]